MFVGQVSFRLPPAIRQSAYCLEHLLPPSVMCKGTAHNGTIGQFYFQLLLDEYFDGKKTRLSEFPQPSLRDELLNMEELDNVPHACAHASAGERTTTPVVRTARSAGLPRTSLRDFELSLSIC